VPRSARHWGALWPAALGVGVAVLAFSRGSVLGGAFFAISAVLFVAGVELRRLRSSREARSALERVWFAAPGYSIFLLGAAISGVRAFQYWQHHQTWVVVLLVVACTGSLGLAGLIIWLAAAGYPQLKRRRRHRES
jgi:hypothetical protein